MPRRSRRERHDKRTRPLGAYAALLIDLANLPPIHDGATDKHKATTLILRLARLQLEAAIAQRKMIAAIGLPQRLAAHVDAVNRGEETPTAATQVFLRGLRVIHCGLREVFESGAIDYLAICPCGVIYRRTTQRQRVHAADCPERLTQAQRRDYMRAYRQGVSERQQAAKIAAAGRPVRVEELSAGVWTGGRRAAGRFAGGPENSGALIRGGRSGKDHVADRISLRVCETSSRLPPIDGDLEFSLANAKDLS